MDNGPDDLAESINFHLRRNVIDTNGGGRQHEYRQIKERRMFQIEKRTEISHREHQKGQEKHHQVTGVSRKMDNPFAFHLQRYFCGDDLPEQFF